MQTGGGEASSSSSSSQPCSSFNACFLSPFLSIDSHNNTSTTPTRVNKNDENDDLASATSSSLSPYTHFTNHESLPPLQHSYHNFLKSFPQFTTSSQIDQIRSQEYNHLNISNTCFDYNGYGLFSYAQHQTSIPSSSSSLPYLNIEQSFFDVTLKSLNLHSQILYGGHESEIESIIKEKIMAFMNVSESDYSLVLIANEVSAFKLIAESFQFQQKGELLTVYDHNSEALETMTESCKKQGVKVLSAEFTYPNLGIHWKKLKKMISKEKKKGSTSNNGGLFVFPLYSRVTGAPYSYVWMSMAQENGWSVLLDVCGLRPKEMDTLGMSMFKPDFMVCSFYKVFGDNPSGFGCLFVKKTSLSALKDSGNAGIVGLVPASCGHDSLQLQEEETEIVEQTLNEGLEIDCRGLDHAETVGLILISRRSRCLINWLVNALMSLQHPHHENRFSLIRIYGPKVNTHRGPSLAFNIFDWKAEKIDPALVQKLADRNNISLSKSFLKNIRFLDRNQLKEERQWALERKATHEVEMLGRPKKRRGPEECGIFVVTVTLGFLTNFEDCYRLWAFLSRFLDADFVEKERWRYMALNQKTIEV